MGGITLRHHISLDFLWNRNAFEIPFLTLFTQNVTVLAILEDQADPGSRSHCDQNSYQSNPGV